MLIVLLLICTLITGCSYQKLSVFDKEIVNSENSRDSYDEIVSESNISEENKNLMPKEKELDISRTDNNSYSFKEFGREVEPNLNNVVSSSISFGFDITCHNLKDLKTYNWIPKTVSYSLKDKKGIKESTYILDAAGKNSDSIFIDSDAVLIRTLDSDVSEVTKWKNNKCTVLTENGTKYVLIRDNKKLKKIILDVYINEHPYRIEVLIN